MLSKKYPIFRKSFLLCGSLNFPFFPRFFRNATNFVKAPFFSSPLNRRSFPSNTLFHLSFFPIVRQDRQPTTIPSMNHPSRLVRASTTVSTKSGLKADPLWTPTFTEKESDNFPRLKYQLYSLCIVNLIYQILWHSRPKALARISLGTRSKAFSWSSNTKNNFLLLNLIFLVNFLRTNTASTVPFPDMNLYYILPISTNSPNYPSKTFS